jgi:meso-butanediol dehydrogenase / (S,S)-butanediol dehydrogenase / diacetyl reductase
MEIQNKVLVVTGGASGIGLACCEMWRDYGGNAAILDIIPHPHEETNLIAVQSDVTSESRMSEGFEKVFNRFKHIDAVFHSAGIIYPEKSIEEVSLKEWHETLDVHLTGGFITSKVALPYFRKAGGGSLIFCSSISSLYGAPCHLAYAAAKAGLNSLTLSLAHLLGHHRIRVNAICPGSVVGTGLLKRSRGIDITMDELACLISRIPLRRAATPRDIAEAVCFLASPEASHISGAILPVDGGERLS